MKRRDGEVPNGTYDCYSADFEVIEDDDLRTVVIWGLRIVGGKHDSLFYVKKYYIANQFVEGFLRRELAMLGLKFENMEDLNAMSNQICGKMVRIMSKVNAKGYSVISLTEVLPDYFPKW